MIDRKKIQLKWESYWFKTFGRWRSCPLTCPIDTPHPRHIFWSWIGSFLAITATSYLAVKTNSPLLMAPFGATSVLIFGVPDSPLASPWAMGMAVSSAIGIMQITRTLHPPSGAVALVVMMTKPDWKFLLTPAFEGSIILVLCAVIFNNLAAERTYPNHWL